MTCSATGISKSPSRSSDGSDEAAKAETRATAAWARDQILKLLHPFMPFITEELWARTATDAARQPADRGATGPTSTRCRAPRPPRAEMHWVIDLIKGVRSVRAEMNVPAAAKIALVLTGRRTTQRRRGWRATST